MRGGNKYCGTKTHTLHIKDVDKSDNGSYQCLVKNGVRKELSEEADLGVGKFVVIFFFFIDTLSFPSVYVFLWGVLSLVS